MTLKEAALVLESISVATAAFAAVIGINAWKREYLGKKQIDLAEEVLGKFFEVRDAISFIRNPWSNGVEGNTRKKNEFELTKETEILNRAYVAIERHEKKKATLNSFYVLKYKFMASFGKETESLFTKVSSVVNKILISSQMLGTHYWQRQGRVEMSDEEFKKHLDEMWKQESIFWETGDENDVIKKELSQILEEFENVTRKVFKK